MEVERKRGHRWNRWSQAYWCLLGSFSSSFFPSLFGEALMEPFLLANPSQNGVCPRLTTGEARQEQEGRWRRRQPSIGVDLFGASTMNITNFDIDVGN